MPDNKNQFKEVLPKQGLVYQEEQPTLVLCKPKLLPLKSVTLEKMEKMQKDAQDKVQEQEMAERLQQSQGISGFWSQYSRVVSELIIMSSSWAETAKWSF